MNETFTVIAFLIAILCSLAGGLLLGYFYARTRNGQTAELDALKAEIAELRGDVDALKAKFEPIPPAKDEGATA